MQKKSFFITFSLFLFVVSSSAGADGFQNSCEYSFKKAVYSITQHCALNFYEGETTLTYGESPIATTAACTADRDIGPMGFEEAEALSNHLVSKLFDESNKSRIGGKLFFNENDEGLEARLTMSINDDEQVGDYKITRDQISDGTFFIDELEFNMTSPQTVSFELEDTLKFQLSGECKGPYFESSHIPAGPIIALSDGEQIKKGDIVLKISQLQDPSPEEFLGAIENVRKNGRISVLLLILRDEKEKFMAVDVDQITSLFFPNSITIASSSDQNSNNDIQGNALDANQSLPGPNTQITTATISSKLPDCPSTTTYWHNCLGTDNYPNGSRYIGEWKDGKEHGQGIFIWADGEEYIGQWMNGKKHGQGTYTYPSGDEYVGEHQNGVRHGRGTYTYPSGAKYVGEYQNGVRRGRGTYTYPSGAKYVGEYQNGVRRGQGTYTYPSGAKIVGEWANGELNGYAVEYNADGTILKQGIWKDDEFQIAQNTTPSTTDAFSEQRKLALLIGNAEYLNGPLDNPVNDARLIGATLKSLGFEVYIHENANQKTMKRAIRDFGKKLELAGEDAVGLFYFSGHGLQSEGENYLSPIGAEVRNEADVEIEMVSANAILKQMDFARNGLNIVILDACRTNRFSRGFRSAQNGLADMAAPTGSILAYATAPDSVAYDGRGDNSPYAGALAEAMLMPNTPVEAVFKAVRISVINETDEKQVPWESSSLTGEFMFNPD
ncbi:caspase family protein [bacterium]|nr:caspase family protein [bacterium]MDB9943264.1 caspase family protein [bacterium]